MSKRSLQRAVQQTVQRTAMVALAAIALGMGGCTATSTTSEAESLESEVAVAPEDPLQVVTTFLPMTQFTIAVAGDRAEVAQLLPTNVGPHEYQAKPGDVQAIVNADVLVKNGLEIEFFLDDMIENAENADLTIIDSSESIATLASADDDGHSKAEGDEHGHSGDEHGHSGDEHGHSKGEEHDHAEGDDHGHTEDEAHAEGGDHAEGDIHGHAHGEFDPHIWLDPKRVIGQVENIRDGLIAADPEGEAEYTANAEAFMLRCKPWTRILLKSWLPLKDRPLWFSMTSLLTLPTAMDCNPRRWWAFLKKVPRPRM